VHIFVKSGSIYVKQNQSVPRPILPKLRPIVECISSAELRHVCAICLSVCLSHTCRSLTVGAPYTVYSSSYFVRMLFLV